ncbi:MAG: hypothetical protein ACLU9S_11795 [Oscillospiraceae bacterium]
MPGEPWRIHPGRRFRVSGGPIAGRFCAESRFAVWSCREIRLLQRRGPGSGPGWRWSPYAHWWRGGLRRHPALTAKLCARLGESWQDAAALLGPPPAPVHGNLAGAVRRYGKVFAIAGDNRWEASWRRCAPAALGRRPGVVGSQPLLQK